MGMTFTKIISVAAIASAMATAPLGAAFAGSAGAADSRGPQWPQGGGAVQNGGGAHPGGGAHQGGGAHNGGAWQGGGQHPGAWREGGWHGDHERHPHGGGFGWAPFVLGGVAAGAAIAGSQYYEQPEEGDPCYQLRPTYDQWNNYVGRQWVNVCQ